MPVRQQERALRVIFFAWNYVLTPNFVDKHLFLKIIDRETVNFTKVVLIGLISWNLLFILKISVKKVFEKRKSVV